MTHSSGKDDENPNHGLSRRTFLGSLGGAAVGAGALATGLKLTSSDTPTTSGPYRNAVEPFYGPHQGGIASAAQSSINLASFDVTTSSRDDLRSLLRRWSETAANLAAGRPADPFTTHGADVDPDSMDASGLGASRLTVTIGFGASLFEKNGTDRFGLKAKRPAALIDLPAFNGDALDEQRSDGDLIVQACADDPQVAFHAIRQFARSAEGIAALRWSQTGFNETPASTGTARDLLGFKDGTINPKAGQLDDFVWAGSDAPRWMRGGTYLVARRIRIDLAKWDATTIAQQEHVIGRSKTSGAPLGEGSEFDALNLHARDAKGDYILPLDSHVRLSSQQENLGLMILRRSYAYNDGVSYAGGDSASPVFDSGLVFVCFQYDPRQGFIPIFKRLAGHDALRSFTTHTSSVLAAVPPGASGPGHFVGEGLFA